MVKRSENITTGYKILTALANSDLDKLLQKALIHTGESERCRVLAARIQFGKATGIAIARGTGHQHTRECSYAGWDAFWAKLLGAEILYI